MQTINENQAALVQAFAKANKISKDKATQFACQLIGTVPKSGRSVSEKTESRINTVYEHMQKVSSATAKDVAAACGLTAPEATNCLRSLEKAGKIKASKKLETKVRGPKPTVFIVSASE